MKKYWVLAGLISFTWAGCQTAKGPRFDPRDGATATNRDSVEIRNPARSELLTAPTNLFTLGPGDKLEVEIVGDVNSRTVTSVGPDGKIYFYLLPGVDVWGMTLSEARNALEQELEKYDKSKPAIGVTLRGVESKRVWLLGKVAAPGIYPMSGPITLLEAVTMAGGATRAQGSSEDLADLRHSFVIRKGKVLPVDFHSLFIEGDMSQNIYLEPDDFVYFPSTGSKNVYVLGAVGLPQSLPYREELSLVAAVAAAGGTLKGAYLSHVALVRGSLTEPKIAVLDYKSIVSGRGQNVRLQPGDILYVPYSPYRTLAKYANLIVETFVSAMAINEGARAATKNAPSVGVNIGIGGVNAAPAVGVGVRR